MRVFSVLPSNHLPTRNKTVHILIFKDVFAPSLWLSLTARASSFSLSEKKVVTQICPLLAMRRI